MIKKSIEHRAAEQARCTSHGAATLTHRAHMLHSFRNRARQLKKITQEQVCCIAAATAEALETETSAEQEHTRCIASGAERH